MSVITPPNEYSFFSFDQGYSVIPDELTEKQVTAIDHWVTTFLEKHPQEDDKFAVGFALRPHRLSRPDQGSDATVLLVNEFVQGNLVVDIYGNGADFWLANNWDTQIHGDFEDLQDEECDDED